MHYRVGQHEPVLPVPGPLDITYETLAPGRLVSEVREGLRDFMHVIFETVFAENKRRTWIMEPTRFLVSIVVIPFRKLAFQTLLSSYPNPNAVHIGQGVHPARQVFHVDTRGGMGTQSPVEFFGELGRDPLHFAKGSVVVIRSDVCYKFSFLGDKLDTADYLSIRIDFDALVDNPLSALREIFFAQQQLFGVLDVDGDPGVRRVAPSLHSRVHACAYMRRTVEKW